MDLLPRSLASSIRAADGSVKGVTERPQVATEFYVIKDGGRSFGILLKYHKRADSLSENALPQRHMAG